MKCNICCLKCILNFDIKNRDEINRRKAYDFLINDSLLVVNENKIEKFTNKISLSDRLKNQQNKKHK